MLTQSLSHDASRSDEYESLLRSLVVTPAETRLRRTPLVGTCPGTAIAGSRCWKFLRHDPGEPFDFWMLLTSRPGPKDSMICSLVVPRPDGGLMHCVKTPVHRELFESRFVQVMKASAGGFGPVSVSRMKVRVAFEETRSQIFGSRFLIGRYDTDLRLIASYEDASPEAFPALPAALDAPTGEPSRADEESVVSLSTLQSVDLQGAESLGGIHFHLDPSADELTVDGGEVIAPLQAETLFQASRAPGLYLDLAFRNGLSMTIASVVAAGEAPRIAFVDYCTGFDRDHFRHQIIVRKSGSWLRRKKKIIHIREELRETGVTCGVLHEDPEVTS